MYLADFTCDIADEACPVVLLRIPLELGDVGVEGASIHVQDLGQLLLDFRRFLSRIFVLVLVLEKKR